MAASRFASRASTSHYTISLASPLTASPLNILQIVSGRNVNGALTYCKFISEQLQSRGHRLTVLCRPDGWLQENMSESFEFVESELNRNPLELLRVAKWIKANKIDLIHTHMSRGHSFGVLMRLMTGVPVVATAHNCSFQVHWNLNDYVLANSQSTFDYHTRVNRLPSRKMEKVFCFTELERFKQVKPLNVTIVKRQMRLRGDEFLVGTVGEIVARKGHYFLFQALQEIVEAVPNFKLVLLGRFNRTEPYVKKLRSLLKRHGLHRRVKWLGLRNNVEDFMSAFDVCVVPSIEEPLGLVALEALAAGTPVVATRTGGLPEIVKHEQNGLLVPPKNPGELAKAIIRLAASTAERERFGQYGREWVRREFDPIKLTDRVEEVFVRVAAQRGNAKHLRGKNAAA